MDLVHKTTVVGLLSYTGFQFYQIVTNVREFEMNQSHAQSTYFEETEDKIRQESQAESGTDYLNRYRKEDYLKDQVKAKS